MTPQQAINQLKRDGFSDEEIIEAVLPIVREKYLAIRTYQPLRVNLFEDDLKALNSWAITKVTTTITSNRTADVRMEMISINDPMETEKPTQSEDLHP